MDIEKVDLFLNRYNENSARCAYLEVMIEEAIENINRMKSNLISDSVSITQSFEDHPHGSNTESKVEKTAVKLADGYLPDYIKAAMKDLEAMQDEYKQTMREVGCVNAMLRCLSEKERFVVEQKYFGELSWAEMIDRYAAQNNGTILSKQTFKNIMQSAKIKMANVIR